MTPVLRAHLTLLEAIRRPSRRVLAATPAVACALLLGACGSTETPPDAPVPTHAQPSARPLVAPGSALGLPMSSPLEGPAPGEFKHINLPSGRHFLLHLPADYDPAKKWPVILSFHGWKESAWAMYSYSHFKAAEAITIYPQGQDRAWATAPYATTTPDEDVQFVEDIIDSVRATYSVDDTRIHAAGMSNGGGFAVYLSCRMPGVLASVASVSAAYYFEIHDSCAESPVGRLDIHGTKDPVVSYEGGHRHGVAYRSVREVLEMDRVRNRCSETKVETPLPQDSVRMEWIGCQAPLEHIRIAGGTHVWPGGAYDKGNGLPKGFATDAVLDFFAIPGREAGTETSSNG